MQVSPPRYRVIAICALAALAAIIVTGAAVRLTNSGLGCDDWPNCSDTKLIDVSTGHAAVEQINRLFTGVVGVAVIAAVLASRWRTPRRRDLTVLSWWLVAGVVANAVLGGISVKVDLHPIAVQGHMLLSMLLIVVGTVLVRRAGEPDRVPRVAAVSTVSRRLVQLHFALTSAAIFTGTLVTGAGPHAGDEDAERLDVAIPTITRVHGITVMATIAASLLLAWQIGRSSRDRTVLQRPLSAWIAVAAGQTIVGYVQYLTDVPPLLVGIHVAGATAVMWASTRLALDLGAPAVKDPPTSHSDLLSMSTPGT
jgi:cytochrome c oxidase assembly protein subunit 15